MWRFFMAAFIIQPLATEGTFYHLGKPVNPEVYMNSSEIITFNGYPSEEYQVITEDLYILTLNRIPYGKMGNNESAQRPVVFLQHGFIAAATMWIANLPNNSLAFLLADAGCDVWMGNSRGSTWSKKHVILSPNSQEFWTFSFDEMAKYDLPAVLGYIVNKTGQKIHYVGHSEGSLIGFIAFSNSPELAEKIQTFYALAPVFYLQHIENWILKVIFKLPQKLIKLFLGDKDFASKTKLSQFLATTVCDNIPTFCAQLFGFDSPNLNKSRIDIYTAGVMDGSSAQNALHYVQLGSKNRPIMQAYDWGDPKANMVHYNQPTPPVYDISDMKVPTALWSGQKDSLANPTDVAILLPQIRNKIYYKSLPNYGHVDFICSINIVFDIFPEMIEIMKKNP